MAVKQEETALAVIPPEQVRKLLATVDTTGLSEEEKYQLAGVLFESLQESMDGVVYRPQRFKIVKDMQQFVDPLGVARQEINGVMIVKQTTRGFWIKNSKDKRPLCSSKNGKTGRPRVNEDGTQDPDNVCATCEHNQWGSAMDEAGTRMAGKACKEMRRIYLMTPETEYPVFVSLPPTSLAAWDDFISARLSCGISDLASEVILALTDGNSGGYSFSVVKPRNGAKLKALDVLKYAKIQKQFAPTLLSMEVEADDYEAAEHGEAASEDNPLYVPPVTETTQAASASDAMAARMRGNKEAPKPEEHLAF
jgi:hypothetical protein